MFWKFIGQVLGTVSMVLPGSPLYRAPKQLSNALLPNELLNSEHYAELRRRGIIDEQIYNDELVKQGIPDFRRNWLFELSRRLIGIEEVIELRLRENIDNDEFSRRLSDIGIDETDAQRLLQLKEIRLDPQTIITAWRRGLFQEAGDNNYFNDLRAQGWTDDRIELIKKATEFFPAPQDLIRFGVREVYRPDIVEKFEMDQDLPEKFLTEALKAGVPKEQAVNYWRAHWELPSPLMGFEMLHRDVIDKDELDLLLRTIDIMPFWRKRITEISYKVLTRVDVRRMHKVGVLTDDEVKRSYLNLGYNDSDAQLMTDFTISYNADTPDREKTAEDLRKEELRGLTRSNIIGAYKDNIISSGDTLQFLRSIGLTNEVSEFHISTADYDIAKEAEKQDIDNVKNLYVSGGIDFNTAVIELDKLDLSAERRDNLLSAWTAKIKTKTAQPSKGDLALFLKGKVIDKIQWRAEMSLIGFPTKYIDWYQQSLKIK